MTVSWLKQGEASVVIAKQEEAAYEMRKEEQGKMSRFWMKEGEECRITFVDGDLDPEKQILIPPRYYEHMLYLDGSWNNHFVCPEKTAPHLGDKCPICAGNEYPYLASLFTIIDHREWQSQKNPGKVYKDQAKLFVAKAKTVELLNKIAVKRGGLAGCTFDVMRIGEKSANVGTNFDFVEKQSIEVLKEKYVQEWTDPKTNKTTKICVFVPAKYEEQIVFRTGAQLEAKGFGAPKVSGYSNTPSAGAGDTTDYANQL